MELQNPHDKMFKETLGDVETAKHFLTHYLPQSILQVLDIDTLEPQKDSFINPELQENFSDLLFKVNIGKQQGYLYLLFEHKSYSDKGTAFQLLKYMVEIWDAKRNKEKAKALPIIIPLVLHHAQEKWKYPSNLGELLHGYNELPDAVKVYVPNFDFLLYDVSRYSDEEIKGNAQLRILLTLFRDLKKDDIQRRDEAISRSLYYLSELESKQTGLGYLETMMRYIFAVAQNFTKEDFNNIVKKLATTTPEGSEVVMTLAELLRQEGMEQGIEKGLEKGFEKAKVEMVQKLILKGMENTFIQEITQLPLEKIEQIRVVMSNE